MLMKSYWWKILMAASFAAAAWGQTFGTVVPIGGEASDLALDKTRGLLYIADFTGNSIDVMSLATNRIVNTINVAAQPSSICGVDGRPLSGGHQLRRTQQRRHFVQCPDGDRSDHARNPDLRTRQPPIGVAFGSNGLALVGHHHRLRACSIPRPAQPSKSARFAKRGGQ